MTKGAVVTGGAGFLGSQLDLRLLAEDIEAVCLDEPLTGAAATVDHSLERHGAWLPIEKTKLGSMDALALTLLGFAEFVIELTGKSSRIEYAPTGRPHGASARHHPRPAGHGLTAAQRGRAGFEAADGRVVPRVPPSDCTLNSCRDVSIIWATRA